jgi:hypothetical protein
VKAKPTSWAGCSTPNECRPSQKYPNPPPGSTPEAAAAAKKDMATALKEKAQALIAKVVTPVATNVQRATAQGPTQGSKALADRRDQEAKLKADTQ